MKNNQLTRFDTEGQEHENSKLGGIPQGIGSDGKMNTVETGETKLKNYVYSNRLSIDENMTKEMNLPSYIKGKTFAAASKAIDNKFKDRNDNHSLETKKVFLERLKEAQETLKQQEQERAEQIAQSMQSNQQEVPDMMNGEIPEGMEEFTEQPKQFWDGGNLNLAEIANMTGGLSGMAGKASPYLGAASGALSLGSLAQGNGASPDKFKSSLNGALTGAQAGMTFGPLGAGIGAAVGIGAGLLGANKANKAHLKDLNNQALAQNRQFQDNNFAYGGNIKKFDGGGPVPLDDSLNGYEGQNKVNMNYNDIMFKPTNTISQVGAGKPSDFLGYTIKPKNILPKPPTADMNTNIIQNIQSGLNVTADGIWGPKSNQAYFNDRIKRDPEYAALAKKKGLTTADLTNSDFTSDNISEAAQKRFGLTSQGYKYLDPETPDTSMLKPQVDAKNIEQEKPINNNYGPQLKPQALEYMKRFERTPPLFPNSPYIGDQGIEIKDLNERNGYSNPELAPDVNTTNKGVDLNSKKELDLNNVLNKTGDYIDKNGGKFLKYAPVAMNAYQLAKLKKPVNQRLQRLDDKYKAQYVDEAALQNVANQEMTNTINGISQSGASQGAIRNSILGAGLNKTKALSDAYMKANAENRATDDKAQQFNLGVNQFNTQTQHQESENWERNKAAYDTEKSRLLGNIGENLGNIGKEEVNKNQIAEALGYDVNGDYVINKKTGEKMLTKDFEEKVKNGTLNKKYNFGSSDKFSNTSINYTPTNFKIGRG